LRSFTTHSNPRSESRTRGSLQEKVAPSKQDARIFASYIMLLKKFIRKLKRLERTSSKIHML